MRTVAITLGSIAVAVLLVAAGIWLGAGWSQRQGIASAAGPAAMMGYAPGGSGATCDAGQYGGGMMGGSGGMMGGRSSGGMMGGYGGMMGGYDRDCPGAATTASGEPVGSLEEAQTAVGQYVADLGYTDLEVAEVMEFEDNYYAIVAEKEAGIGAMEVLIDKQTGRIGQEPGPNMMWNAKYGMMGEEGGMMGGYANGTGEMTLSPDEAMAAAQVWLDENLPGRTPGDADPFYGYFTFHFLKDGQVEGMLSVNGSTGAVWYHNWHGAFIGMTEEHD